MPNTKPPARERAEPTSDRSSFNNHLLSEIRMGSDDWSDAMVGMFAVCDYMQIHHPDAIDPEWGYRPAMGLRTEKDLDADEYPLATIIDWRPTREEIVYTAKILNRYTDWLRAHGRSY